MHISNKLRLYAIFFFFTSILLRLGYNIFLLVSYRFMQDSGNFGILSVTHIVASSLSILLAYLAINAFWKANTSGSNLGCFFLIFCLINFVAAVVSMLFALADVMSSSDAIGKARWF
ncbi:MAG: hypothetical protein ACRCYO_19225 [Bacteroidia bacterium]